MTQKILVIIIVGAAVFIAIKWIMNFLFKKKENCGGCKTEGCGGCPLEDLKKDINNAKKE